MNRLKETFRKNGLPYQLIQRNEFVAMYGVGNTYTDIILHYEVCAVHFKKKRLVFGNTVPKTECLPSNERFGIDMSRAIVGYIDAQKYYTWLSRYIKMSPEGKKHCPRYVLNPALD